ncbi:hypothetical protein CCMSSC00406_0007966 [Pleurotus cornucopiae]|uniref:Uncharacterized protein n=1 Tax=Pleurotus cornucopiae TaxID=5321 RepID=A0ACB7ILJ6_PLECO|nr:hypothetical protein CCMSSC00406_0007966 [Pleurotus cornucopiae]
MPYPIDTDGFLIHPTALQSYANTHDFNLTCLHDVPARILNIPTTSRSPRWRGHTVAACGIGIGRDSCGYWLSFTRLVASSHLLWMDRYPLRPGYSRYLTPDPLRTPTETHHAATRRLTRRRPDMPIRAIRYATPLSNPGDSAENPIVIDDGSDPARCPACQNLSVR